MNLKVIVLTAIGLLFLLLGTVGLFLPVWPTTPFILVAAGCLVHTPRLHALIMRVPFFREYIENYREKKGLSKKTAGQSLVFLWGMLLLSMFLIDTMWIRWLLAAIGVAVTAHILWIAKARS